MAVAVCVRVLRAARAQRARSRGALRPAAARQRVAVVVWAGMVAADGRRHGCMIHRVRLRALVKIFILFLFERCAVVCAAVCAAVCAVNGSETPCTSGFRCAVLCAVGCALAVL